MSITIKRTNFNALNGVGVTGFKLYRSALSRADCETQTTALVEMDLETHEHVDDTTEENKLYWYRVDADTEFGVSKGEVRCMQWSNVMGIATGDFIYGDYECGYMTVDETKTIAFREAAEFQVIAMMRQAGFIMSGSSTMSQPAVYSAVVVDGTIMLPPRNMMNITSGGNWINGDRFVRDMLASHINRVFAFDGCYYEIDIMKMPELAKIFNSPSANMEGSFVYPNVTTGFPVLGENQLATTDAEKYRTFQIGFDPALQRSKNVGTANSYNCDFVARLVR